MGTELSRTVATFIVQKILTDELGLSYICATPERFFAVGAVLTNMVDGQNGSPSPRLLKHILRCAVTFLLLAGECLRNGCIDTRWTCRCYLRLVDNPRAKEALKAYLPKSLITAQLPFREAAENDQQLMQLLLQLRSAVGIKGAVEGMPGDQQGHQGNLGPGMLQGMQQSGMNLPYGSAFQNSMQQPYRPR